MSCLNDKGVCIIEWTTDDDNNSRPMDPFAASLEEYKELISQKYEILDILENNPKETKSLTFNGQRYFFVINPKLVGLFVQSLCP